MTEPIFADLTELSRKTGVSKRELDRIVRRLVKLYHPLRIYLFGSFSWGVPHWNSDLDFCVVVETDEEAMDDTKGRRVFSHFLRRATDFYLLSKGEFEKMISNPASMEHKIHHEADILYAKPDTVFDENQPLHREEYNILHEAKKNLGTAKHMLIQTDDDYRSVSLFHVQQCIETSFRAFWAFHLRPVMKVHELDIWRRRCGRIEPAIKEIEGLQTKEDAERITKYYWLRYRKKVPVPSEIVGIEAEIEIAERVYKFVKHYIETTEPPTDSLPEPRP